MVGTFPHLKLCILASALLVGSMGCRKSGGGGDAPEDEVQGAVTAVSGGQPGSSSSGGTGTTPVVTTPVVTAPDTAPSTLPATLSLTGEAGTLQWSDLRERDVSYALYIRMENGTYDFDEPLTTAQGGSSMAVPPLPGRFCFIVRATSARWTAPRLSNEVCLSNAPSDDSGTTDSSEDSGSTTDGSSTDDGGDDSTPPPAPILTAGLTSAVALPGDAPALTLSISTNLPDTPEVSYAQLSGPAVTLTPTATGVTLTAPSVAVDTFISVRATVSAGAHTTTADGRVKVVASFAFLGADATTGSNWEASGYGAAGIWIPHGNASGAPHGGAYPIPGAAGNDDLYMFPSGLALSWNNSVQHYTWANPSSAAAKAMFRPGQTSGIESCLYHPTAFDVDVTQAPASRAVRVLRVYVTDHEDSRELDVVVRDKDSGTELHRFAARAADAGWRGPSAKGYWLSYRIRDDVTVRLERVGGANVILQGMAFDPYFPTNQPPVAHDRNTLGHTLAATLGVTATDADGDALSYAWTQTSGPTVTLSSNTSAAPTFTAPSYGEYVFTVRVRDWSSSYDDATVRVTLTEPPTPPSFLGADSTTGPYWQASGYGTKGYYLPAAQNGASANTGSYPAFGQAGNYDLASLPSGASVTWGAEVHSWIWANPGSTSDRSIERPGFATTVESCLWHESVLRVRVTHGTTSRRTLRVYVTDHEDNRELDIRLKSADGSVTHHTFAARASDPNWRGAGSKGYWLSYDVGEDVMIEITALSANAILQGLVFD